MNTTLFEILFNFVINNYKKKKMKKTVFITGTNSGFGKAMTEVFANHGWNVAATVRDQTKHPKLFKELSNVKLYDLDVTNYEQVNSIATQAIEDFKKIDAVINNAGYCLIGPTETATMEQIENQFKANVFGLMAVTKAFIPHMRENKDGIFFNFASSSAQFNYPFIAAYGASKWAVRGISESLGIELASFGIEVKTIYPGSHGSKIFTKLDHSGNNNNSAYQHYKQLFTNFFGANSAVEKVSSPESLAVVVYEAVNNPKKGKLHILQGPDVKMMNVMRKLTSQRGWLKQQIGLIAKPPSDMAIRMAKFMFRKGTAKMEVIVPKELTN
jgi:NADP-dependent 3-hydroxy acid dehydrogenase YdfG